MATGTYPFQLLFPEPFEVAWKPPTIDVGHAVSFRTCSIVLLPNPSSLREYTMLHGTAVPGQARPSARAALYAFDPTQLTYVLPDIPLGVNSAHRSPAQSCLNVHSSRGPLGLTDLSAVGLGPSPPFWVRDALGPLPSHAPSIPWPDDPRMESGSKSEAVFAMTVSLACRRCDPQPSHRLGYKQ